MRISTLARHPLAIAGAVVATASAAVFITLVIAMLVGMLNNPYAGLVVFIAIPAVFAIGLLLIPAGMSLERRKLLRNPSAVSEWPVVDFRRAEVRRATLLIAGLTAVNLMIILLAGYGGLHAMETPSFCGQACHAPMHPQFQAWQGAMHSGVPCVECHIGEGAAALVHAKLSGVRQLMMVAVNTYPKPIAPGAKMPPGAQAELCSSCHKPGRVIADRVRVLREYADDEANTETMTALQMHMSVTTSSAHAIHWHADPAVRVEYVATDAERQTIPYVRVTDAKGQVKEFVAPDTKDEAIRGAERQKMDCIDCHNTVGHPISPTPEQAVDRAIAAATVSRELPFVRRESVRLVKESHATQEEGVRAIEEGLRNFYRARAGSVDPQVVTRTVGAVQEVYRRNVFPAMKVTWGSYPDNKGHMTSNGCFRCHDDSHEAKDGSKISGDCEYCHKQLETQP
jgi:nitrate/TMAO reductase-like tetraheme cytochrome c subunit